MNVEKLIKDNVTNLKTDTFCRIYISPDIPDKKLNNAISTYAKDVEPEYVLAVIDTSVFGGAKDGFLFTGNKIFCSNVGTRKSFELSKITEITTEEYEEKTKDGETEKKYKYYLTYDGEKEDITGFLGYVQADEFVNLINLIIDEAKGSDDNEEVKFESTNQTCPLAMMGEDIKEKYIQLICNFAYADDNQIDSKEYAEIMTLITINSVDSSTRIKIRSYMYDETTMLPNLEIITYLRNHVDAGSIEALELSIIKDVINIFVCKSSLDLSKVNWKDSEQVVTLANELNIPDDKVNYIAENIIKNKEIITKRQDDLQIKKNMQELASKAGAVGVPLAAVYLSGSVIGVSAAGMTSGLAALGMGGVLGFSSMFTGIGVAVLLGVGAYKGIKKVTGMGDLERSKQRELMLKEIAKNSQKALNYLIEDVNELSKQLQIELVSGAEAQIKIKKLAGILAMLTKGAEETSAQINNAEKENLICKLPLKIKPTVIEEMASGATKKNIRELILNAYNAEKVDENGETVANCLNTQLPFSELELVYNSLEAIGFYSMSSNSKAQIINSAKGIAKGLFK